MTQFHPSDRDVNRVIRSWLHEDRQEDVSRIAGVVLDQLDATPQRRTTWWPARRSPDMNKFLAIGLGAAAVVAVLLIGSNLLDSSGGPPPGGDPSASAGPSEAASSAAPSRPAGGSLPEGPFVMTDADVPVQITVDISSSGWYSDLEFGSVYKNDDGLDPPESVNGVLIGWAWPVGTGFNVYGDPCQWATTIPDSPATTPEEIAADLAAQSVTDATAPAAVTVDGYAGMTITLQVPMSFQQVPDVTREVEFADCDLDAYGFYQVSVDTEPSRNAQGPGQLDQLWILDVDGSIVILDAAYSPATPADLVAELQAMAESATFEVP